MNTMCFGLVELTAVSAFGKVAEIMAKYGQKGKLILVEGRIKTRMVETRPGERKYYTDIIGENIQLGPDAQNRGDGKEVGKEGENALQSVKNEPQSEKSLSQGDDPGPEDRGEGTDEEINVKDIPS